MSIRAKLIVIEGTDCSGKETQSNLLLKRLNDSKIPTVKMSFPMYDTPTGQIVGGSYLGKAHIGAPLFKEGATNVDPKVAALYYAADRKYNIHKIIDQLEAGNNVLLDRYVESNMAHQGSKIQDRYSRASMYEWLEKLEYGLLELPRPDLTILLYMPFKASTKLKNHRSEAADQHEASSEHLQLAEEAYLELAKRYDYDVINCTYQSDIRSIDDINEELFVRVRRKIKSR